LYPIRKDSAVHWMEAFISIESPSYHANSFRCWSHSCLTFCRLLYPKDKDKTGMEHSGMRTM
ncbi:MAG: hypothetical protein LBK66_10625, partial [Spirochaetaceae bacterium]|nr:hypothetical protein [Spirochaetaceae bacterium]